MLKYNVNYNFINKNTLMWCLGFEPTAGPQDGRQILCLWSLPCFNFVVMIAYPIIYLGMNKGKNYASLLSHGTLLKYFQRISWCWEQNTNSLRQWYILTHNSFWAHTWFHFASKYGCFFIKAWSVNKTYYYKYTQLFKMWSGSII